jgi:hypothetical protein
MAKSVRLETILNKLFDIDIYFREFLGVDLDAMQEIKQHRDNVVDLDSEQSEDEGLLDQWQRSILTCEH